jgi:hypothetical protein
MKPALEDHFGCVFLIECWCNSSTKFRIFWSSQLLVVFPSHLVSITFFEWCPGLQYLWPLNSYVNLLTHIDGYKFCYSALELGIGLTWCNLAADSWRHTSLKLAPVCGRHQCSLFSIAVLFSRSSWCWGIKANANNQLIQAISADFVSHTSVWFSSSPPPLSWKRWKWVQISEWFLWYLDLLVHDLFINYYVVLPLFHNFCRDCS